MYYSKQKRSHTDSNMATPLAPILPLGVTPRPPINPAQRSLKEIITYQNYCWAVTMVMESESPSFSTGAQVSYKFYLNKADHNI